MFANRDNPRGERKNEGKRTAVEVVMRNYGKRGGG
jgi:hypothetical protein